MQNAQASKGCPFLTHTIRLESYGKEICIIRCMWNVKHGIFAIKIGFFGDCVGGVVVVVYAVVVLVVNFEHF